MSWSQGGGNRQHGHDPKARHSAGRQTTVRRRDDPVVSERARLPSAEIVADADSYVVARSNLVVLPPALHEGSGMKQWKGGEKQSTEDRSAGTV
jgi:hypothetical protein